MKKEDIKKIIIKGVNNTVKGMMNIFTKHRLCGGILCIFEVENEVNAAIAIKMPENSTKLDYLAGMLWAAAAHDKLYMKAMVVAGLEAEIRYTKDEEKRKVIREKVTELAELFDE